MTSIRRGPWWAWPFLYLGKTRNILVPHVGRNVPFVIKNYPYRDGFLFGYEGPFQCEFIPATDAPAELKPIRHERRT